MDGLTLAYEIRKHRNAETLPLVLLTSLGQLTNSLRSACSATLVKPIKPLALFEILLNICAKDPSRLKQFTAASPFDATMGERLPMRILLADDNVVNQKVGSATLTRFGYRADIVGNGKQVLEALGRQSYDLILMDVHMPEMDGLEATERICLEWPNGERPGIVAMTASALPEDVRKCLAAGWTACSPSPCR